MFSIIMFTFLKRTKKKELLLYIHDLCNVNYKLRMITPIMTLIIKQIETPTYQKHSIKKNSLIYFELCKIKLMKHGY
jgi:hypothetical protein